MSFAHAGGMGDSAACLSPFFSLEGGYAMNRVNGYEYTTTTDTTTISSVEKRTQYTGRLAAGVLNMVDDQYGLTAELGWGYYGQTKLTPPVELSLLIPAALSTQYTISGFDILVGGAFIQQYYSLSLKLGALVQNMQVDNHSIVSGMTGVGIFDNKYNVTGVLPTVKFGVSYNVDANWSIVASYLLAWGATNETTITYNPATTTYDFDHNAQNPMINAGLIGIQYVV
jgi:hypothetical protein